MRIQLPKVHISACVIIESMLIIFIVGTKRTLYPFDFIVKLEKEIKRELGMIGSKVDLRCNIGSSLWQWESISRHSELV